MKARRSAELLAMGTPWTSYATYAFPATRGLPMPIRRPILFFHIPKTGGSSVALAFRRVCGAAKVRVPYDTKELKRRVEAVDGNQKESFFQFLAGHISPRSFYSDGRFIRSTVVREPISQLISHFCFSYKARHAYPVVYEFMRGCRGYREGQFSGDDVEMWIQTFCLDNFQVRFLSGEVAGPVHEGSLELAKDALKSCELVGVTEQLSGYIRILAHTAGLQCPGPVHVNRSMRGVISEPPVRLHDRLKPYVQFDSALHDCAKSRFELLTSGFADGDIIEYVASSTCRGEATFYERLEAFFHSSGEDKRFKLKRRALKCMNLLRDYQTHLW